MSFYLLTGLLIVLCLPGCSLNLPAPTSEGDRDLTGRFDGKWALESSSRLGNCGGNFERAYMEVKNGVGKIGPHGPSGTGNISTSGEFRIDVPNNRRTTHIKYGGNLDDSTGRAIVVHSAHRAPDCSSGLSIRKVD